jgi:biopolymer transport protein ExbD
MSAIAFRSCGGRKRVTLSVTPLIDVLFLLIIFFAITGTFKRVGELELRLPDSSTATPPVREQSAQHVELLVFDGGRLRLNGEEIDMPQLKGRLMEILKEDPESQVTIKAEAAVSHGEVVWLLDIVRGAGYRGVGIGTHMKTPWEGSP